MARLVPSPVVVEGPGRVGASPRAVPGDAAAPAVIHLLNRDYDGSKDAVVPQQDLVLRVRRDLFAGRRFAKATLHAPNARPQELKIAPDDQSTTVHVPKLDLWAIVEFSP